MVKKLDKLLTLSLRSNKLEKFSTSQETRTSLASVRINLWRKNISNGEKERGYFLFFARAEKN